MKISFSLLMLLSFIIIPFYSQSQNPNTTKDGVDTLATINSFAQVGDFYSMDYSGDYSAILDWMDDQMTQKDKNGFLPFECSLCSANGDPSNQLFGRNFDNPENDVLLARYSPPNANASMAFTRMNDLGFAYGTNYSQLTFEQKLPLLFAAYFVPDGINEFGLSAGLASVDPVTFTIDPTKDTIFVTRLIREILDHANTVAEALGIANSYNVFDNSVNIISHHVLVGSPSGESVVLEFSEGEFQAVYSQTDWQVLTNIPVYNVSHQQLMNSCWRYNTLYTTLEENLGSINWQQGMEALEQVHLNCPWSAIYDMTNRAIYAAVHNNYDDIVYVDLETFDFVFIVDIPEITPVKPSNILNSIFPNPFSDLTRIEFTIAEKSMVELSVYDVTGKKIITLQKKEMVAGEYSVSWEGVNEQGEKVLPGIYFCRMVSNGQSTAIRIVLTGIKN
ncbi:MAG: linear amide C-N hydrolase [Bacteroidales bacterium]|nr:linear amide C-N hydrolase [Bacteroidales bacterium]